MKGKLSLYQETAVISLIDECMANGWRGIIWDKLNKKGGFSNVRKSDQESPSGSTAETSKQKIRKLHFEDIQERRIQIMNEVKRNPNWV